MIQIHHGTARVSEWIHLLSVIIGHPPPPDADVQPLLTSLPTYEEARTINRVGRITSRGGGGWALFLIAISKRSAAW